MQLRIADAITAFAGSMRFVYIHAIGFALWMVFVEPNPWPKLTLIVSLEAIFLSTFVMIGQNRAAAFQQAKADHDFVEQEHGAEDEHRAHAGDPQAHDRGARPIGRTATTTAGVEGITATFRRCPR